MPFHRRRPAFTLIEAVLAIAISAGLIAGTGSLYQNQVGAIREAVAAGQQRSVADAVNNWFNDNYDQISAAAPFSYEIGASAPSGVTTPITSYLPLGFATTNAFGDNYEIRVNSTATGLDALLVTGGGLYLSTIAEQKRLPQIGAQSGQSGGYVAQPGSAGALAEGLVGGTPVARGAYGSYSVNISAFPAGTIPNGKLHLASLLHYDNSAIRNDSLYRYAVPNHKELTTEFADVSFGGDTPVPGTTAHSVTGLKSLLFGTASTANDNSTGGNAFGLNGIFFGNDTPATDSSGGGNSINGVTAIHGPALNLWVDNPVGGAYTIAMVNPNPGGPPISLLISGNETVDGQLTVGTGAAITQISAGNISTSGNFSANSITANTAQINASATVGTGANVVNIAGGSISATADIAANGSVRAAQNITAAGVIVAGSGGPSVTLSGGNVGATGCIYTGGVGCSGADIRADNGTVTAAHFHYVSDAREKTDIERIRNSLDRLTQIDGVTFDWKRDGHADIGVLAQQVAAVFPEAVTKDPTTGQWTVEYGNLIGPTIEAVHELKKELDNLRNEPGNEEARIAPTLDELRQLSASEQAPSMRNLKPGTDPKADAAPHNGQEAAQPHDAQPAVRVSTPSWQ